MAQQTRVLYSRGCHLRSYWNTATRGEEEKEGNLGWVGIGACGRQDSPSFLALPVHSLPVCHSTIELATHPADRS
uniref:Uncharacterized protein n=1 Tax=Oryza nivara TaxID=4536 RepID=A0A0E0H8L5_ORYNI